MVLSFAHTVGEFGVVLMVGGNIPGVTRTVSVAIYDEVQALNYAAANTTNPCPPGTVFRGPVRDLRLAAPGGGPVTAELEANFEKRFAGGALISAQLRRPTDGFSVTALFGPSGSGKTTMLRCLAGLERPEAGTIRWGEATWFDAARGICLSPQQRGIGYLFQEYALFPHLSVAR